MDLLVVSGLSGAGKSLAVNVLEDIGYFCIDNIPAGLVPRLLEFAQQGENMLSKVAVVLDIRGARSSKEIQSAWPAWTSSMPSTRSCFWMPAMMCWSAAIRRPAAATPSA